MCNVTCEHIGWGKQSKCHPTYAVNVLPNVLQVYSLGLFSGDGCLMGMLVAELQSLSDLESELGPLLHKPCPHSTVMYILSLGEC